MDRFSDAGPSINGQTGEPVVSMSSEHSLVGKPSKEGISIPIPIVDSDGDLAALLMSDGKQHLRSAGSNAEDDKKPFGSSDIAGALDNGTPSSEALQEPLVVPVSQSGEPRKGEVSRSAENEQESKHLDGLSELRKEGMKVADPAQSAALQETPIARVELAPESHEGQANGAASLKEEKSEARGREKGASGAGDPPEEPVSSAHSRSTLEGGDVLMYDAPQRGQDDTDVTASEGAESISSRSDADKLEANRPDRLVLQNEASSEVTKDIGRVAGGSRHRQQQGSPRSQSSNGSERRLGPEGGGARHRSNPSGSRSPHLDIPQPLSGPQQGVRPIWRQASGGHGRGWQNAPPPRYTPQGLGKGAGFHSHEMSYNGFHEAVSPGLAKTQLHGRRSQLLDGTAGNGQSLSPESPLNWRGPGSPNVEELSLGPQALPPVPQPLPPTLAEGGTTFLIIEWQQSPLSQCYCLDMALSSDRLKDSRSRGPQEQERLVGESLDWRPVYSGKDSKCQVTGLKPGQSYWFRVRYVPAVTPPLAPPAPPPPSMPAFFWTHCSNPGAPPSPSLASCARSNLKVKWSAPAETGGKPITQYQLKMRPPPARTDENSGASWQADADGFVEIYQGSDASCKVPRLVPGQDYAFRVRAFNCMGAGPFSPEAIFSTHPSVPAQPGAPYMVAQTATSATLQWDAPHSGGTEITSYMLEIDDGEGGAFAMVYSGPEMICEIQALRSGYTYRCRVLAENEVGRSAFSVPVGFQTGLAEPSKPSPPTVSSRGPTSLTLTWEAPEIDGGAPVSSYCLELWDGKSARGWTIAYEGPSRACTVNGLQSWQQYRARVQASNCIGSSVYSDEVTVVTAAAAPEPMDSPILGDSHQSALLVRWAPPRHDGGARISGYRLEMQSAEDSFQEKADGRGRVVYTGLETSVWVKDLQPGCAYSFRIQSYNKLGSSAWSAPTTFQTLAGSPSSPGPPTLAPSAATTSTSTQLPLTWDASVSNGAPIISYCLQMCVPVSSEQRRWAGESAQSRTGSPRRRQASTIAESGSSTDLADIGPSSPELFRASGFRTPTSEEAMSLENSTVDDEAAYDISSFSEGGQDSESLGEVSGVQRWCQGEELPFEDAYVSVHPATTVVRLMPHTLYAFRVRATNSVGSSDYGPISYLVTASAEPAAPPPLTVIETGQDHVHLKWEKPSRDNGESIESYTLEIERRSSNRSASSSASPGVNPSPGRSANARNARVVGIGGSTAAAIAAVSKDEERWEQVYSGTGRECLVDSLDPGCPYQFRVRAWNAVGASPPSTSVLVHTDPAAPSAPAPPSFSAIAPSSVRVRWSPPEEDNGATVRSYKLGADDGLGGPFRQLYEGSALKHAANKLVPGRTYRFRVQAISEVGASAPSTPSSVTLPRAPPRAPLPPVAKSASTTTLVVAWEAPGDDEEGHSLRTGFTVQMEETTGGFRTIYEGDRTSCEVKGLSPGTSYRFRVRSNGPSDVEQGPWSPTAALSTEASRELARPKDKKPPSQLKRQLSKQIDVLHREADKWQGVPMRRAVTAACITAVLVSAYVQFFW